MVSEGKVFKSSDLCGIQLKQLVLRGHDLIAYILQLSNEIPVTFRYDYEFQERKCASTHGGNEKKTSLSSILWKKISTKKSNKKLLRRQVASYTILTDKNEVSQVSTEIDNPDKYQSVLIDFAYLGDPDKYDSHLHILDENDTEEERRKKIIEQELLEAAFFMEYEDIINQYHELFESVLSYYHDIYAFLEKLQSGYFIQYEKIASILAHEEGAQLLVETLYLHASAMIAIDLYIPGTIRERFIIAHKRFSKISHSASMSSLSSSDQFHSPAGNFEQKCKIFERVENSAHYKNRKNDMSFVKVSEGFVNRLKMPSKCVEEILSFLLGRNIYPDIENSYPDVLHQYARLSKQSSMFFVLLQLQPDFTNDNEICRHVVDRYLGDNWVIPLYNGELVDLSLDWDRFGEYIESALPENKIATLYDKNARQIILWIEEIQKYLDQNALSELYVLEHFDKIMTCVRNANVALKWRILHRASPILSMCTKKGSNNDSFNLLVEDKEIVDLFLLLSRFEVSVKSIYISLLSKRTIYWKEFQQNAASIMTRLSHHFCGKDDLLVSNQDPGMSEWFCKMSAEIENLEDQNAMEDVQFCIDSLTEIGRLDQIDSNSQAKKLILLARLDLCRMVKCETIKEDILVYLDNIIDTGYARVELEYFIPVFHQRALKDPKSVGLLRSSFLKAATYLNSSNGLKNDSRISKASEYHSRAMLILVKKILDVIPIAIFSTYTMIADLSENSISELPAKIDVNTLSLQSYNSDRGKIAKVTFELSILTKGIIDMKETNIGHLRMNPQELLEEGLRKELVLQISIALHRYLRFTMKRGLPINDKKNLFMTRIIQLAKRMDGFQLAIVWLQDYLKIDGLNIYFQELSRVIWQNTNVEMGNVAKTVVIPESNVPIPILPKEETDDVKSLTFVGRTVTAMLLLLDSKSTSYCRSLNSWFTHEDFKPVIGTNEIARMKSAIGVQGLHALEYYLCNKISLEIESLFQFYENALSTYGVTLEKFRDGIFPEWQYPRHGASIYSSAVAKLGKLFASLSTFLKRIGTLQLLRKMIKTELLVTSRVDADSLVEISQALNSAVMERLYNAKTRKEGNDTVSNVAKISSALYETIGEGDVMSTIFVMSNTQEGLPSLLVVFIINCMANVKMDRHFQGLKGKEDESFDGWVMAAGVGTLLRQFHATYTEATFALLGQFVKCALDVWLHKKDNSDNGFVEANSKELGLNTISFMKQIRDVCDLDHDIIYEYIPQHLCEMLELVED